MSRSDNTELFIGGFIVLVVALIIFLCCDTIFGKDIAEVKGVVTNTYYVPSYDEIEHVTHNDPKTGRSWVTLETHHHSQEYHVIFSHSRWYYDRLDYWSYGRWNRGMTAPFYLREGRWTGIIRMIPVESL